MSLLDAKQILYKHQYGFRAKHSTIHPIIHLLNECAEANNNNPKCDIFVYTLYVTKQVHVIICSFEQDYIRQTIQISQN